MDGILSRLPACPGWCTTGHGIFADDLDDLHTGDEVPLASGLTARLCCTVDAKTGDTDGPYIIVGSEEWSPRRTAEVGSALIALSEQSLSLAKDSRHEGYSVPSALDASAD